MDARRATEALHAVLQLCCRPRQYVEEPMDRAHEKHAYAAGMPGSAAAVEAS